MNGAGLSLALLCALWLLPASALAQNARGPFVQKRDRLAEKIEAAIAAHLASRPSPKPLLAAHGLVVIPAAGDLSTQGDGADSPQPLNGAAAHEQREQLSRGRAAVNPGRSQMTCAVEEDPPILTCIVWSRSGR